MLVQAIYKGECVREWVLKYKRLTTEVAEKSGGRDSEKPPRHRAACVLIVQDFRISFFGINLTGA